MKTLAEVPMKFDANQVKLIKDTYCKGASDSEFEMFLGVCKRTQLDPFSRQVYAIKMWDSSLRRDVLQAVPSIDGFRVIAERSGKYEGQTAALFCGDDGIWTDVWLKSEPPRAAKVGVYKEGHREPTYCVALWSSYARRKRNGELMGLWKTMPDIMLSKCAESLALRKAFPNELSGLYSAEEMDQAKKELPLKDVTPESEPTPPPPKAKPSGAKPKPEKSFIPNVKVSKAKPKPWKDEEQKGEVRVISNTFADKDKAKAAGFTFDKDAKEWFMMMDFGDYCEADFKFKTTIKGE